MTRECQEILWYSLLAICSTAMVKCTHKSHLGEEYFSSQFKGTVHRDSKVTAAGAGAAGHTACGKGAEGDGDAGHSYFSFVVHRRSHP